MWDSDCAENSVFGKILSLDGSDRPYQCSSGEWYDHASPWERGIPEAIRKAVEG